MRVAIIGCGLIGQKRARNMADSEVAVCCDPVIERAEALSRKHPGATVESEWKTTATRSDVDAVVIATPHDMLAHVAEVAASSGKHVLLEKPGARCARELEEVSRIAKRKGVLVRVGFNH